MSRPSRRRCRLPNEPPPVADNSSNRPLVERDRIVNCPDQALVSALCCYQPIPCSCSLIARMRAAATRYGGGLPSSDAAIAAAVGMLSLCTFSDIVVTIWSSDLLWKMAPLKLYLGRARERRVISCSKPSLSASCELPHVCSVLFSGVQIVRSCPSCQPCRPPLLLMRSKRLGRHRLSSLWGTRVARSLIEASLRGGGGKCVLSSSAHTRCRCARRD